MNDSKKSLALNLTIVIHKESDSRRGSFVVRKSIAFPCAQLLGDHRKGDVNTPPPLSHVWLSREHAKGTRKLDMVYLSMFLQGVSVARLAVPLL